MKSFSKKKFDQAIWKLNFFILKISSINRTENSTLRLCESYLKVLKCKKFHFICKNVTFCQCVLFSKVFYFIDFRNLRCDDERHSLSVEFCALFIELIFKIKKVYFSWQKFSFLWKCDYF